MPKFLVRQSCEYSIVVEAEDAAEAYEKADKIPTVNWDHSWSPAEIDEDAELEG